MRVVVVRTYLEMASPTEAALDYPEISGFEVRLIGPDEAPAYREVFQEIGREVLWISRWDWTDEDFAEHLKRNDIKPWMASMDGVPAGLIEGRLDRDGSIEYGFVGIRPRFQGKGLGKYLLNAAIEESWKLKRTKIWLFTLTTDGEHALKNYLRRGFRISKRRATILEIPENLAPRIMERMEAARARGIAPGLLHHVEAFLRESWPGKIARRIVWELKQVAGKLAGGRKG